jgi:hypothetical protein
MRSAPGRVLSWSIVGAWLALGVVARGEDFRVDSRVTMGEDRQTFAENTTIFHGGRVYDFLSEPAGVTVFDPKAGRFTILDQARQVQTVVSSQEVNKFMEKVKTAAAGNSEPFLQFLANPKFQERMDAKASRMQLTSEFLRYEVSLQKPVSGELARQYTEFSDWYAKLNTMLNVGGLPPFARMTVNARLRSLKQLPSDVHLTIVDHSTPEKREVHFFSEHTFTSELSDDDLEQVKQVAALFKACEKVELAAYLQPANPREARQPRETRKMR